MVQKVDALMVPGLIFVFVLQFDLMLDHRCSSVVDPSSNFRPRRSLHHGGAVEHCRALAA